MHADLYPAATRVLLALIDVHQRQGHATVREVTDAAGLRSPSTTMTHLVRLRRLGFVSWETGRQSTLHPLVRPVLALST